MARTRVELDSILRTTLGSTNVYFDPPESFKLKYPCIVYSYNANIDWHAENARYIKLRRYTIIYITKNADDDMVDTLENLEFCHLNRVYNADGLWHYAFDIYF